MPTRIAYSKSKEVISWVEHRMRMSGFMQLTDTLDAHHGVGVEKDGGLVGGLIYKVVSPGHVELTVAGDVGWITKTSIRACFDFAFNALKAERMSAQIHENNDKSIKVTEWMGFVREGVLRKAQHDGADTILYGLLRDECKWIK